MNAFEAIILGILQGLTEFLPVSSSGHLVLFQHLFGLKEAELFFDVCVHLGTLVAVIVVFRREIIKIVSALLQLVSLRGQKQEFMQKMASDPELKMALFIVIGSIPTANTASIFFRVTVVEQQYFFYSAIVRERIRIITIRFYHSVIV